MLHKSVRSSCIRALLVLSKRSSIYVGCIKATTNNRDIRPSVSEKALLADILWMAGWIHTIEFALESAH